MPIDHRKGGELLRMSPDRRSMHIRATRDRIQVASKQPIGSGKAFREGRTDASQTNGGPGGPTPAKLGKYLSARDELGGFLES